MKGRRRKKAKGEVEERKKSRAVPIARNQSEWMLDSKLARRLNGFISKIFHPQGLVMTM